MIVVTQFLGKCFYVCLVLQINMTSCLGNPPYWPSEKALNERVGISPMGVGQVSLTREPLYRKFICLTRQFGCAVRKVWLH